LLSVPTYVTLSTADDEILIIFVIRPIVTVIFDFVSLTVVNVVLLIVVVATVAVDALGVLAAATDPLATIEAPAQALHGAVAKALEVVVEGKLFARLDVAQSKEADAHFATNSPLLSFEIGGAGVVNEAGDVSTSGGIDYLISR
jgi:hypothetical protein